MPSTVVGLFCNALKSLDEGEMRTPMTERCWVSCAAAAETAVYNSPPLKSPPPPAWLVSFGLRAGPARSRRLNGFPSFTGVGAAVRFHGQTLICLVLRAIVVRSASRSLAAAIRHKSSKKYPDRRTARGCRARGGSTGPTLSQRGDASGHLYSHM